MAVLLMTSSPSVGWVGMLLLAGLGVPALLAVAGPKTRRIGIMVAVAAALGAGLAYAVPCCQGCDPFWLQYFYICI
jgi:hypothetical protein